MRKVAISLIPGDGIGIEVTNECIRILRRLEEIHGGLAFMTQRARMGMRVLPETRIHDARRWAEDTL